MTRHYCCYFDERYMARGVAMIRSLRHFEARSLVWVLCLTDECFEAMSSLGEPGVRLIRFGDFEAGDDALAVARTNRSTVEYYFTCTPSLILYVMDRVGADDLVTYVDGDLFFFSAPEPLHQVLSSASVTIIEHRFPERLRKLERFGRYNVGWLGFRNDGRARAVAQWWRDRCNEWCYDRLEDGRFADQGYLDQFENFDGVAVIHHAGANLAPWNLARHRLSTHGGQVLADGQPVIFFHFHGLKQAGDKFVAHHFSYRAPFRGLVRDALYVPYVAALAATARDVAAHIPRLPKAPLARDSTQRASLAARLKGALQKRLLAILPYVLGHVVPMPKEP